VADSPGPLFDWTPPPASPPKHGPDVQRAELARCLSANERHVMAFLRKRMKRPGRAFYSGKMLLRFVHAANAAAGQAECAPDTPRRLVGELEAQGECQVVLISRRRSLYEVVAVSEEG